MKVNNLTKSINHLIEEFNFTSKKKYKLISLFGLLGDFDSFEYAINLKTYLDKAQNKNLDILVIAIGNEFGLKKFCKFTGLPTRNIRVVPNNEIHIGLGASKGIDIGLGGWINLLIMLSGLYSLKTIKEVLRGYTGDKKSKQIFSDFDQINILNFIKFPGSFFKYSYGEGYLRPFELATFRLKNMIEIISNWNDYILSSDYLPQRGATFLLDGRNQIIYKYFSDDVLGYSPKMQDPIGFLVDYCK